MQSIVRSLRFTTLSTALKSFTNTGRFKIMIICLSNEIINFFFSYVNENNKVASRTYFTQEYLGIVTFQNQLSRIGQNDLTNSSRLFLASQLVFKKNGF
jgi:hypothetical protein